MAGISTSNKAVGLVAACFVVLLQGVKTQQYPYRYMECPNIPHMIRGGPKIRGKVQKKGILPLHLWWNISQYDNFKDINQKLAEEHLQFQPSSNTLLKNNQPVRTHIKNFPKSTRCQVFIDPENKLIYMKNAKTGGSSITTMLQRVCRHVQNLDIASDQHCLRAPEFLQINDEQTIQKMWQDYFVFTTVRNPYSRAASGYKYLLQRREKLETSEKFGCQKPSFQSFSLNPFILGVQSQHFGCTDNEIHDYLHVEEETQCLMTKDGEFAVDYIFSIENFEEDWIGLVEEIVRQNDEFEMRDQLYVQKLTSVQLRHVNSVSSGQDYVSSLYGQCGRECINNIANYYKTDFKILGYRDCLSPE